MVSLDLPSPHESTGPIILFRLFLHHGLRDANAELAELIILIRMPWRLIRVAHAVVATVTATKSRAAVGGTTADRQNFGKMLLVFGCIGTDLCKEIRVLQHFSKSTRISSCNFRNLATFCKFCNT